MSVVPIDDLKWLASDDGRQWLARTKGLLESGMPLHRVIGEVRRKLGSAGRASALVGQCRLREQAKRRFAGADRMLFDERLLQQATDERLASFKARRFVGAPAIVDVCCGLGGDTLALSAAADVVAVDQSEVACFLASFNTRQLPVPERKCEIICDDAASVVLPGEKEKYWFHVDPDRRANAARTIRFEQFSPGLDVLNRIIERHRSGAIKTAPASALPEEWETKCERQWLGNRHECLQQVLWFGDCARSPGKRSVAAVDHTGEVLFEWTCPTRPGETKPSREDVALLRGMVLHECHPAVYAAELALELAGHTGLKLLDGIHGYLIGTGQAMHGALAAFDIVEMLPMDASRIRQSLEHLDCGTLEVKHRGIDHRIAETFRSRHFRFQGQKPFVLILAHHKGKNIALICERRQ